jgi:hypothetical protein
MRRKKLDREVQVVVDRVLPLVPSSHAVAKGEFEVILGEILRCVGEKTGAGVERIAQVKDKVLTDLPNEYGRRDARDRSWSALIAYLYTKFLRELSVT